MQCVKSPQKIKKVGSKVAIEILIVLANVREFLVFAKQNILVAFVLVFDFFEEFLPGLRLPILPRQILPAFQRPFVAIGSCL